MSDVDTKARRVVEDESSAAARLPEPTPALPAARRRRFRIFPLLIALAVYGMPAKAAMATAVFGAAYGLFPIGWIILNLIFLYQLTVRAGLFEMLRSSLSLRPAASTHATNPGT